MPSQEEVIPGAISGYALKKIIKLAAIILGAFFLGLAFLSYKGWINANWNVIQNQTYSGMMNASQAAQQYIQSTMQHMSTNPAVLQGQGDYQHFDQIWRVV